MIALSIRQPWAWLIVNGHKDIENRDWKTNFRGRLLIHTGKVMKPADYEAAMLSVLSVGGRELLELVPAMENLPLGGVVGVATVVDCVSASGSPWFTGGYEQEGGFGFVLEQARPLAFTPAKGKQGFFYLPGDWGTT